MSKTPTVKRIFEIIDLVLTKPGGLTHTDIQRALSLPKSTLSGLLGELVEADVLCYDIEKKTYVAGTRLIHTSILCRVGTDLVQEIGLVLNNLAHENEAYFHAGVLNGTHVVYVAESRAGAHARLVQNNIIALPAHASSLGKMLLSQYTPEEIERLFAGGEGLVGYTDNTLRTVQALVDEVEQAKKDGYVMDKAEFSPFIFCIAVPIERAGKIVAAISASVPRSESPDLLLRTQLPVLQQAKREIEARVDPRA